MLALNFYSEAQAAIENAPADLRRHGYLLDGERPWGDPLDLAAVATCLAFLASGDVRTLKALCRTSSYEAKHWAERWGREHGAEPHVGNGDFIAAALHGGTPAKRIAGTSNAAIGIRLAAGAARPGGGKLVA